MPKDDNSYDEGVDVDTLDEEQPSQEEEIEEEYFDDDSEEENIEEEPVKPQKQEQKQDSKQNAAFAKMRKELDEANKKLSNYNNWAGKNGSNDMDHLIQIEENKASAQKRQELIDMGYDPDVIKAALELDPEYQANKIKTANLEAQLNTEKQNQKLYEDFNALSVKYPKLVTVPEDITEDVWDLYRSGYSLKDAFLSANEDKIMEMSRKEIKQKTLNNVNGKQHLKTEGDGANDVEVVSIPMDVMDNYLDMGMSKQQAQAHYKKLYGGNKRR